jgi:hypothetical protein
MGSWVPPVRYIRQLGYCTRLQATGRLPVRLTAVSRFGRRPLLHYSLNSNFQPVSSEGGPDVSMIDR